MDIPDIIFSKNRCGHWVGDTFKHYYTKPKGTEIKFRNDVPTLQFITFAFVEGM